MWVWSWLLDWLVKRVLRHDKPEVEAVFDGLAGGEEQADEKEGFHGMIPFVLRKAMQRWRAVAEIN